ncbi:hypothetical protein BASA60_008829 [Batrachochytrium salamandrivorans]|nr:hypothetical protein BASA60_008829 [Batrachochytrium salamandrivorans]
MPARTTSIGVVSPTNTAHSRTGSSQSNYIPHLPSPAAPEIPQSPPPQKSAPEKPSSKQQISLLFNDILNSLKYEGPRRLDMLSLSDSKKLQFIRQYHRRKKLGREGADHLNDDELELIFVEVLNAMGLQGSARENLSSKSSAYKRNIITQYQLQKGSQSGTRRRSSASNGLVHFPIQIQLHHHHIIQDTSLTSVPYSGSSSTQYEENSAVWFTKQLSNRDTVACSMAEFCFCFTPEKGIYNTEHGSRSGVVRSIYADAVLEDELRYEVVQCVRLLINSDSGMHALISSIFLLRQIIWCLVLPPPESRDHVLKDFRQRRAFLNLRSLVGETLAPLCLLSDAGRRLILQALLELSQVQDERAPFQNLVLSLNDPFCMEDSILETQSNVLEEVIDGSELWDYRTSVLVLINALVSSAEEPADRWGVRRLVESRGIRSIVQILLTSSSCTDGFRVQAVAYEQDRIGDIDKLETIYKERTREFSDPQLILNSLLKIAHSLPDPQRSTYLVMATLDNFLQIMSSLKTTDEPDLVSENSRMLKDVGNNRRGSCSSNIDHDLQTREESSFALTALEKSTRVMAGLCE